MFFKNLTAMIHKPHYKNVYLYPASEDLSHIPDSGSQVVLVAPDEVPNGVLAVFTFTGPPKYLQHNGQWLLADIDFTVAGNQATLLTIIPETGAILRAVI
jgi:hypothetical protein